jgi:hypothetical protein
MKAWKKVLIGAVSVTTLGIGANLAASAARGTDDSPAVVDVSGPCDEAEHATDPRCDGTQVAEDQRGREDEARGREDEAENEADDHGMEDENEAENEAEEQGDDRSGPSDRSGREDGANHDRDDDRGRDD